jgi:uncharacterized damage-inducible protein DinB
MVRGPKPQSGLQSMPMMLLRYKQWANALTFRTIMDMPESEMLRPRATRFGNIVHTLNHVYVVDDIFRHHLSGRKHGYQARNTDAPPPVAELRAKVQDMDMWYLEQAAGWTAAQWDDIVRFEFVGGGAGAMTRREIALHLVNHATYHRGFVGDMLHQAGIAPPPNDLPVFLRDVYACDR